MATCATHPTLASSATCRIDARRACGCVQPFTYSIKPAIRRPIVEFKHRNSIPNRHLQQTRSARSATHCKQKLLHLHSATFNSAPCRVHATAVAEVAQLGEQVAEGLGVLGIGAAGLLFALWNTEKGSKAAVEQELQDTKVIAQRALHTQHLMAQSAVLNFTAGTQLRVASDLDIVLVQAWASYSILHQTSQDSHVSSYWC